MEQMTEAWIDVPETDGRFQISNKGHLRRIAKKKRLHKETMLVFEIAPVKMVADYKTGMFGWYVYFDNDKHFFERDKLMELFGSIPVALDQEEEREALRRIPRRPPPPNASSAPAPGLSSVLSPERPLVVTGPYAGRFLSGLTLTSPHCVSCTVVCGRVLSCHAAQ